MESNEEELADSLNNHKIQLKAVEDLLMIKPSDELVELKEDIMQLIKLTEESLLALKKSNLLAFVDANESAVQTLDIEREDSVFTESKDHLDDDDDDDDDNDDDDDDDKLDGLYGLKCRVPYFHSWGEMSYQNAFVFCREPQKDKVRVLFCNPTHDSMKLCPYFIEGRCKFKDSQCRSLKVGSKCLGKDSDELWRPGVVVDIIRSGENDCDDQKVEEADVKIKIMFDGHHIVQFDLHDVLPIDDNIDNIDEMSTDNEISESATLTCNREAEDLKIQTSEKLGSWEQHTRGIGSKLMLKMGYIIGEGLGKNSDGRSLPVPVNILPAGKSLDKIMEMKERYNGYLSAHALDKKPSKNSKHHFKKPSTNIFDVLNKKVFDQRHVKHKKQSWQIKGHQRKHISAEELNKKSDKDINIQLMETADELRRSNEEMQKLKMSLERNILRGDKIVSKKIEEKIQSLTNYQSLLNTSEMFMNKQKKSRKTMEELTKF
ncbi:hypothetical protein HELRODRAFT_188556 [Helobdella robusta]|uniref:Zinc finger CCCH-type with G patch domain-containing protein n=1 Tax=Helobdella robusta TaxID=6412 RepID=T1FQ42_HELRO|nr:hypothetical protein HELRODRAFT_188556 [Helobdella robusta]ESO02034.1 hypothetical protein HELRODRAFT_188556 [Helobdella robusta]